MRLGLIGYGAIGKLYDRVELTANGTMSKKGDRVTPALFVKLLDERRDTVKALFSKLGVDYDKTDAELVLTILKRQVVETTPDGRLVPQPRWIKYGSRVLLSIIEQSQAEQAVILDGIFGDRQNIASRTALRAYDFVYDVVAGSLGSCVAGETQLPPSYPATEQPSNPKGSHE